MKPYVLCIFPPVYDFAVYDLYLKPYALLKLGKWFEQNGYDVQLLNCLDYTDARSSALLGTPKRKADGTGKFFRCKIAKPAVLQAVPRFFCRYGIAEESMRELISIRRPDLILVSSGMTYWYPGVSEVVSLAKELWPAAPVVVGGVYATLCSRHAEQTIPADYIIPGEAFPALQAILHELKLPSNNLPADDMLLLPAISGDAAVLRINKGCPLHCQYCASHALSGAFTPGTPQQAFNQVASIHAALGTRNFAFYDDALLACREQVFVPFLQRIADSGMDLRFYLPNAIHLSYVNETVAGLMRRTGFRELRIGFESSDTGFHESLDHKVDVAVFSEKLDILRQAGFQPGDISLYILAGLPGQYMEEVRETIHFAARFGVNVLLAEYSPVPGSVLWEKSVSLSSFPLADEPLTHNNSILPLQWEHFTLADLQELKNLALRICREKP